MPNYIDVTTDTLSEVREGLALIERLDREALSQLDLYIYGITNNPQIIDAAKEAIADSEELDESDVQLTEVAVAIPLDSDSIYYLTGSGLILRREEFAYLGDQGEGVRTLSFTFAHYHPRVNLEAFSKLAVASSDSWLDDFLRQKGANKPTQIQQNVRRDEEATQPGAPVAPQPKMTSLRTNWLDDFLD